VTAKSITSNSLLHAIANRMQEKITSEIKKVSIFTSIIILFFSIASAYLALSDPYTGSNLKGMFNLPFDVTQEMIYALIIFGGLLLVFGQYWITKLTCAYVLKKGKYFA
jgi:hypothetical protein